MPPGFVPDRGNHAPVPDQILPCLHGGRCELDNTRADNPDGSAPKLCACVGGWAGPTCAEDSPSGHDAEQECLNELSKYCPGGVDPQDPPPYSPLTPGGLHEAAVIACHQCAERAQQQLLENGYNNPCAPGQSLTNPIPTWCTEQVAAQPPPPSPEPAAEPAWKPPVQCETLLNCDSCQAHATQTGVG